MFQAVCKKCRRAGEKLFLKGERCLSAKCAMVKKNYPPGHQGAKSKSKLTDYGFQLSYKQRVKAIYGIKEEQLKRYFKEVQGKKGDVGELLLQKLETRLDNVVYRIGLAESRRQARQFVSHGFFIVNGKSVNIPSFGLKVGQEVMIKEKKAQIPVITEMIQKIKKENEIIDWIHFDYDEKKFKLLSLPNKEDIEGIKKIQMIIGFYSR